MATKTISIDIEAYRRLKSARRGDESFSRVIKRVVRPPFDLEAYLKGIDACGGPSEAALDAVDDHESRRHMPRARAR